MNPSIEPEVNILEKAPNIRNDAATMLIILTMHLMSSSVGIFFLSVLCI